MSKDDLDSAKDRRTEAEERFIEAARVMHELATELTGYVKRNREVLNSQVHAFDLTEELMEEQVQTLKQISEGMQLLIKSSAETNAAINENTERLKALLTKVDSYFGGDKGLEYEN